MGAIDDTHIDPAAITPDTPLRLERAAKLAFPDGGVTASTLRREHARGNLNIETVGNKQFTTLRAIEEMRMKKRCQGKQKESASTSPRPAGVAPNCTSATLGSSETERIKSAQASLRLTGQKLSSSSRSPSKSSLNTKGPNTKSPASGTVIPIKSSSSKS
jgi:hypothetical protein